MQNDDSLAVIEIKSFLTSNGVTFSTHAVKVFLDGEYVRMVQDGGTVQLEVEPGEHQVEVRDPAFGFNKSEVITVDAVSGHQVDLRLAFNRKCGNAVLIQLVVLWILANLQKVAVIGIYFTFAMFAIVFVDLLIISKRGTVYILRTRDRFRD